MIDSTIRSYATRSAASLAMAGIFASMLLFSGRSDARQTSESSIRGHATISGRADAVDGDTLIVGGIRVRLEGIDAPELDQTCTNPTRGSWPCGAIATRVLGQLVAKQVITCVERGLDKYKRVLAVCFAGRTDINAEMVRQGLAWAFVRYSQAYVVEEALARRHKIGIWSGQAMPAWDYRTRNWQTAEVAAPAGCPIKGNVNANGRIYHMPWSPWYGKIKMDGNKSKRWFCSESEAVAAGWRPANGR